MCFLEFIGSGNVYFTDRKELSQTVDRICLEQFKSIVQSPSWEANRPSTTEQIPCISWNPEVHYRIHKSLQSVPILSQTKPIYDPHPTSWRPILILSSHLCLGLPSGLLRWCFLTKTLYAPLLSPYMPHAPAHLLLLYCEGQFRTTNKIKKRRKKYFGPQMHK